MIFFFLIFVLFFQLGHYSFQLGQLITLVHGGQYNGRRSIQSPEQVVAWHLIKKGHELIEFTLAKRIKLVIVAFSTLKRYPQPYSGSRIHPVDGIFYAVFIWISPSLAGCWAVAVKSRTHFLLPGGIGYLVPSDLLTSKGIKGFILVEGADNVITIGPHGTIRIVMVSVAVCVTC